MIRDCRLRLQVLYGTNFHRECEKTTAAWLGLDCDCATEIFTNLLANAEAEAVPSHVHTLTLRLRCPEVGGENFLDIRLTDSYAKVFD